MVRYFSARNGAIISEMVRTDFKVRYQGSLLGYAWSLLRPLLLFAVLYVVFVYLIPLGNGVEHYPVYLLTGVMLWNFFTEATTQGAISIVSKGDLLRKINIPKYLLTVSSILSALVNLFFGLVVIFILAVINHVAISIGWLMIIPLVLELTILATGISLLLSALYVKFRDITYIWEVFLQIGFYASAIIFPLTLVGEHLRKWFFINPVVQIVQDARYFVATDTSITMWNTIYNPIFYIVPFTVIAIILVIGILVFKRQSRSFAEDL